MRGYVRSFVYSHSLLIRFCYVLLSHIPGTTGKGHPMTEKRTHPEGTCPFYAVGGIRTLDFMDHFASAERCESWIHEIRKFPLICSCGGCALIESALAEQGVCPGNFLSFLACPMTEKRTHPEGTCPFLRKGWDSNPGLHGSFCVCRAVRELDP